MNGRAAQRGNAASAGRRRPLPDGRRSLLALVAVLVLAGGAAAALLARGGGSGWTAGPAVRGGAEGAPLELSGTDPVSGRPVSLAGFSGRPVVLNLWASWCTGCYAEARALAAFARAHPQAQVVGLDVQDSREGAKAFYRRFAWRHPSISDPQGTVAASPGVPGLPATLFLDRDHRVVARILGDTNLAGFEAGYRRALR